MNTNAPRDVPRSEHGAFLAVDAAGDAVLMRLQSRRAARRQVTRQISHVLVHCVTDAAQRRQRLEQVLAGPLTQRRRQAVGEDAGRERVGKLQRRRPRERGVSDVSARARAAQSCKPPVQMREIASKVFIVLKSS